jgi:hypothetical protein
VIIITRVELALAWDELEDDCKGMRMDVSFWVDFSEKIWVLGTDI